MKKEYIIAGIAGIVAIGALVAAGMFHGYGRQYYLNNNPQALRINNGGSSSGNDQATANRGQHGPTPGGITGGTANGMMENYGRQDVRQSSFSDAMRLLKQTTDSARINKAKNQVTFTGDRIEIAMAAVQPNFPDTTFEVAGLVNPTIVVPAGSAVTLDFFNMDYGGGMNHGVVITPDAPPYPVLSMMGMPGSLVGIPVLPPRQLEDAQESSYYEGSITFRVPASGTYYYLCQYYDHASKGMYGRFIVAQ